MQLSEKLDSGTTSTPSKRQELLREDVADHARSPCAEMRNMPVPSELNSVN